ncbi:cyclic nucleotide-binding protein, partial [Rhodococcus sp. IEGM 1351]|nr:cyclic nucleotide-binding protein [Rhodococcus sp. IEGM 1351]
RARGHQIEDPPRVTGHRNTEVRMVHGEKYVEDLVVADNRSVDQDTIRVLALFACIGETPHSGWLAVAI